MAEAGIDIALRLGACNVRLQVTANALYGFTGAQTSMLQCLPLADSCLAMGAAATRRAIEVVHELAVNGEPRGLCVSATAYRTACAGR